jgi:hypothetical protein
MYRNWILALSVFASGACVANAACSPKFVDLRDFGGDLCGFIASFGPSERLESMIALTLPNNYHPGEPLSQPDSLKLARNSEELFTKYDLRFRDTTERVQPPGKQDLAFLYAYLWIRRSTLDSIAAEPYVRFLYFSDPPKPASGLRFQARAKAGSDRPSKAYDIRGAIRGGNGDGARFPRFLH